METVFTVVQIVLSLSLGWIGYARLRENHLPLQLRIIRCLDLMVPATLVASSANWWELIIFQVGYYAIPFISITLAIIFTPIFQQLKKINFPIKLMRLLTGLIYGSISILLYVLVVHVFKVDRKIIFLFAICIAHFLVMWQRQIIKEGEEQILERFTIVGEVSTLFTGVMIIWNYEYPF